MSPANVWSLVQEFLRRDAFASYAVWGSGIQRSELARSTFRILDRRLSSAGQTRPSVKTAPLSSAQAAILRASLLDCESDILSVADITSRLLGRVRHLCVEQEVAVTLDGISGRCTSAATTYFLEYGRGPTREELFGLAETVVAKIATLAPKLTTQVFSARYAQAFDTEWQRQGQLSLEHFPPSAILLGHDRRPPLLPIKGRPENDSCGTDRSVYSRYMSYRPSGGGARVPFRSKSQRCVQTLTVRSAERDVALEEVRRAAAPYGLEHHDHRDILRGAHDGLALDDSSPQHHGDRSHSYCMPLSQRSDAEAVVRHVIRQRVDFQQAKTARERRASPPLLAENDLHWAADRIDYHLDANNLDLVTKVIIRRLWKALHGLEQNVEEHMCSCSLRATVAVAIDKVLPTAKLTWRDDGDPLEGTADNRQSQVVKESALDFLERCNHTCELLMQQPNRASSLMRLPAGWRTVYAEFVGEQRDLCLSPDQFASWCREVVPRLPRDDSEGAS